MRGVNRATVVGNVGQDPETKEVKGGHTVTEFSVATNEGTKEKPHTEWHNIVTWNKTAEACREYLKRGDAVYLEGRIRTQAWEKDGVNHKRPTIVADRVVFLSQKDRQPEHKGQQEDADDIPF
jgi:single-strand DNA-binding protein